MKAAKNFVTAIATLPRIATTMALLDSDFGCSVIKLLAFANNLGQSLSRRYTQICADQR
jgi:rRNA processing protein Krr1/Pno1